MVETLRKPDFSPLQMTQALVGELPEGKTATETVEFLDSMRIAEEEIGTQADIDLHGQSPETAPSVYDPKEEEQALQRLDAENRFAIELDKYLQKISNTHPILL